MKKVKNCTNAILATTLLTQPCQRWGRVKTLLSALFLSDEGTSWVEKTFTSSGYLSREPRDGAVSSESDAVRFLSYLYNVIML